MLITFWISTCSKLLTVVLLRTGLAEWLSRTVAAEGKVDAKDLVLFKVTDDPAEATSLVIQAREKR